MRVRVGAANGKLLIDMRAFLELGSRMAKTSNGICFEMSYLPRVIEALQRAQSELKRWELGDDWSFLYNHSPGTGGGGPHAAARN